MRDDLLEVGETLLGVVHDVRERAAGDLGIVPAQRERRDDAEAAAQTVREGVPLPSEVAAGPEKGFGEGAVQSGDVRDESAVEPVDAT